MDCVAFFYDEGKGGKNFRKKNKFRCKVEREERSLQKLKNSEGQQEFDESSDEEVEVSADDNNSQGQQDE